MLKLKKGVKFFDGIEVNVEVLVWVMNIVMEENFLFNVIVGKVKFEKVDDYIVNVVVEREI